MPDDALSITSIVIQTVAELNVLIRMNKKIAGVDGSLRLTGLTGEIQILSELARLHQMPGTVTPGPRPASVCLCL
ncbi:hypothetical protein [Paenibacillus tarimensis]|uniref:hypothetical protein n=1 Tax=Paenibacillus tarimensis TaxID=416012 RepID=UPI001F26B697|nr:hypothetical protein [Paenibacillus tarimensis]MCF2944300.1 hypothetical protein [Paenibacillus tarimensis]